MSKKNTYIVLSALLVLIAILQVYMVHQEGYAYIERHKNKGEIVVHTSELVPRSKIAQFIIQGSKIFILYDDVGLVNVYTIDGTFQYGIQVDALSNGRGDIACIGNSLLIKSRGSTIYVLEGTRLLEYCSGTHSGFQNKTSEYLRYEELLKSFDAEKCHDSGEFQFLIGDSGYSLLVSYNNSVYRQVQFLPKRNHLVEIVPFLLLGIVWLILRGSLIPYKGRSKL